MAAILAELDRLKTAYAIDACSKSAGTEFDYGRACGHFQGLTTALLAVVKILENDADEPSAFQKQARRGVPFEQIIDR